MVSIINNFPNIEFDLQGIKMFLEIVKPNFCYVSDAENLLAKLGHWEMPNASYVIKVALLFTLWIVRDQTLYSALSNVLEVVIESL